MSESNTKPLAIGQVARRGGVGVETVRYYEREGLLAKPARSSSGYRLFDEDVIARLQFIQRAKELGFTLSEIKELLSLRVAGESTCDDVRARAEAKIDDIDGKVKSLLRMKKALVRLTQNCNARSSDTECPILDALEGCSKK